MKKRDLVTDLVCQSAVCERPFLIRHAHESRLPPGGSML